MHRPVVVAPRVRVVSRLAPAASFLLATSIGALSLGTDAALRAGEDAHRPDRRAESGLRVAFGETAEAPIALVRRDAADAQVRFSPRGVAPRRWSDEGDRRIARDVAPMTDLVWIEREGEIEELRVLRGPEAPVRWTTEVVTSARLASVAIAHRERGDVIEVRDAAGVVRIASAPMVLVDARGTERPVRASVAPIVSAGGEQAPEHAEPAIALTTWFDARDLAYPIVVDPAWMAVGTMNAARSGHTATLLGSGKVLITGGTSGTGALSSAELWDPATGHGSPVSDMHAARRGHSATLLASGKVLIAGGADASGNSQKTTELFDPATSSFTASTSMNELRTQHTATLLASGAVLVTGGSAYTPGGDVSTAEVFDPVGAGWKTTTNAMSSGRQAHTATLLSTGAVLVAGGGNGGGAFYSSVDLFDPTSATFAPVASLLAPRSSHAAVAISGDRVLVTGGLNTQASSAPQPIVEAELYDPVKNSWTATRPMGTSHAAHAVVALPLDRVLVLGGGSSPGATAAELYEASANQFLALTPFTVGHGAMPALSLPDTSIAVFGGDAASGPTATVDALRLGALGAICKDGLLECATGLCIDGVCCNAACDGQCEACDVPGSVGTCAPVNGNPHGARAACDAGSSTCLARHCDGAGRTSCDAFADTSVGCAPASCTNGASSPAASCDGKGACATPTTTSCGAYACGPSACKTRCAVDADCSGMNLCDTLSGNCVAAIPAQCTTDGLSSQPIDHRTPPKSCAPYRCDTTGGACLLRCSSSAQCAPGASCDTSRGDCVNGTAASGGSSGGCSLAEAGRGPSTTGGLVLAMVAGFFARRVRRVRR